MLELPTACHVCGLTLVSSPHLARSYHHLFPVRPFQEVSPVELADMTVRAWHVLDPYSEAGTECKHTSFVLSDSAGMTSKLWHTALSRHMSHAVGDEGLAACRGTMQGQMSAYPR